mgnify:CR=1 FL=1
MSLAKKVARTIERLRDRFSPEFAPASVTVAWNQDGGLNEKLIICAADQAGPGNAFHLYNIFLDQSEAEPLELVCVIPFQKGALLEAGLNGVSNEALLAIVQHRLNCFQTSQFASNTNAEAINFIQKAINSLGRRTKERLDRGVEGTHRV